MQASMVVGSGVSMRTRLKAATKVAGIHPSSSILDLKNMSLHRLAPEK